MSVPKIEAMDAYRMARISDSIEAIGKETRYLHNYILWNKKTSYAEMQVMCIN